MYTCVAGDNNEYTDHESECAGRVATVCEPRVINARLVYGRFTRDLITREIDYSAVGNTDRNSVVLTGTAVVKLFTLRQIKTRNFATAGRLRTWIT